MFGKILYVTLVTSNQPSKAFHRFGGGNGPVIPFFDGLWFGRILKSFAIFPNLSNIFDRPPERVIVFWFDCQQCLLYSLKARPHIPTRFLIIFMNELRALFFVYGVGSRQTFSASCS